MALKEDGAINTSFVLADITDTEDVQKMVKHAVNKFGQILTTLEYRAIYFLCMSNKKEVLNW